MKIAAAFISIVLFSAGQLCEASDERFIFHGEPAAKGQFPHQVYLRNPDGRFCGGAIIDAYHILTAAHCVGHMTLFGYVLIGTLDKTSLDDGGQNLTILRYQSRDGGGDDISLLRLASKIVFGPTAQPVKLASWLPKAGMRCVVSGWGKTDIPDFPDKMRYVNVPTVSDDQCEAALARFNPDFAAQLKPELNVCAGEDLGGEAGKDACSGDSGGPLTCEVDGKTELVGIVSWGPGCGNTYNVYTEVYYYLDWIERAKKEMAQLAPV